MPEITQIPQAVFLSYAREDADAARRIAEALRGFGVEVWFDQNELRGGDQWDQKIRGQIKACTLFIPVISATTQTRDEAYFRLEWKLADDRSHLMAAGKAFIVPVVIDDTPEGGVAAPDSFSRAQWTRLPAGAPTPQFVEQVRKLLDRKVVAGFADPGTKEETPGSATPATGKRSSVWTWGALTAIAVGVVVALTVSRPSGSPLPVGTVSAPSSEVRQLVEKAKNLQEDYAQDDTKRDNLSLAEQLCKRAVELDPTDAEAWAVYARISYGLSSFEGNNEHRELGNSQVKRALQLAPELPEVKLAQVDSLRKQGRGSRPEAERLIRELVQRNPTDHRVLRMMGLVLNADGRYEEANIYFERAAALPGGDAKALLSRATNLFRLGRYVEAEAAVNDSLALRPTSAGRVSKLWFLMQRGELEDARELLKSVPPSSLAEQRAAFTAGQLFLWLREPENCLSVLRATPLDFFNDPWIGGMPKAVLMGWAHQIAVRPEAARSEWSNALRIIDEQLVEVPNALDLLLLRAQLLGLTGQLTEADRAGKLFEQLSVGVIPDAPRKILMAQGLMAVNRQEEALSELEAVGRMSKKSRESVRNNLVVSLRFDPDWDSVRKDPRFQTVLKELEERK